MNDRSAEGLTPLEDRPAPAGVVEINIESDIVVARSAGRELAREIGFGSADQTRLATAISELTRNIIQYAGSGVCTVVDESANGSACIRVTVEDHGPGIADVEQAMADGFSTGRGLGAGLPGTRRLVHEFALESEPGHTKIVIAMKRRL
jgi:serine/threonine-protein kinase RsbT